MYTCWRKLLKFQETCLTFLEAFIKTNKEGEDDVDQSISRNDGFHFLLFSVPLLFYFTFFVNR